MPLCRRLRPPNAATIDVHAALDGPLSRFGAFTGGLGGVTQRPGEEDARGLPWDVLILFGGGLALADAISETGLAEWLGGALAGLEALPTILLILGLVISAMLIHLLILVILGALAGWLVPATAAVAVGIGILLLLLRGMGPTDWAPTTAA